MKEARREGGGEVEREKSVECYGPDGTRGSARWTP